MLTIHSFRTELCIKCCWNNEKKFGFKPKFISASYVFVHKVYLSFFSAYPKKNLKGSMSIRLFALSYISKTFVSTTVVGRNANKSRFTYYLAKVNAAALMLHGYITNGIFEGPREKSVNFSTSHTWYFQNLLQLHKSIDYAGFHEILTA